MWRHVVERLRHEHQAIPVIGVELEWTLLEAKDSQPASSAIRDHYLAALREATGSLPIYSINSEQGRGQVEAALWHTRDIEALVKAFEALKQHAQEVAASLKLAACFLAKPYADDFGNGLHVHIHLEEEAGNNLYWKREEELSPALNHSIGGLLATMRHDLPVFAGSEAAMARYVPGFNAPTTVSWGMNNRTTALRIPDGLGLVQGMEAVLASKPTPSKRIEHRVASAEASFPQVLTKILNAIEHGLKEKCLAPSAVHGDASFMQDKTMLL